MPEPTQISLNAKLRMQIENSIAKVEQQILDMNQKIFVVDPNPVFEVLAA